MGFLSVQQTPTVKLDTLLIAFSGWADAAEGASSAIKFVERKLTSTKFAEFDPEEFYDFSQTRPQTTRTRDGKRRIHWPKNDFSYLVYPESERGIMVFMGVEPNLRWRTYSNAVAQLAHPVVSHGPQRPIVPKKEGMSFARGYVIDTRVNNLCGSVAVDVGTIAELTVVVLAHGPERTVALDEQAVISPRGNGRCKTAGG